MLIAARLRAASRLPQALRRCTSGVAMTEFAMSLPVLLTLGLVGLETANFVMAHLRVSSIAALTADNASRVRGSIDETDIAELFSGAVQAGQSIKFGDNGRIILSDLEVAPSNAGRQWIRWQRCAGSKSAQSSYGRPKTSSGAIIKDGTEETRPSSDVASTMTAMGPTGNQIAAQPGTAVMVAEVVYDYQPIVPNNLLGPLTISYVSAFNVRQRTDQVLHNSTSMTRASCG